MDETICVVLNAGLVERQRQMNALNHEGWKLVTVVVVDGYRSEAYFTRPRREEEQRIDPWQR